MMLREMICRGTVTHLRRAPVRHAFRYPVWMLYVRLDAEGRRSVLRPRSLLSVDRGHLMAPSEVRAKLASAGLPDAQTATMDFFALTQPRSLGVSFNPVNVYFCHGDGRLAALLVDINNTPWNERYCYVLLSTAHGGATSNPSFRFAKRFHVSPFLPMEGRYLLRLRVGERSLRVAIRFEGGEAPFSACLSLRTRPLTGTGALRCAMRSPVQGMLTLARIYWQAGRLFLKRAPFHPHPAKCAEPTGIGLQSTPNPRCDNPVSHVPNPAHTSPGTTDSPSQKEMR